MNDLQKAYCDGASMAYKDVAEKIFDMIKKAPSQLKPMLEPMAPFAESCLKKSKGVYEEAERLENGVRQ